MPRLERGQLALLACVAGSGGLALVYELCWLREAIAVFGIALPALATVLAAFLGGLAVGSELFGRRSTRAARPIALLARIEIAVGVLGAVSPLAFRAVDAAWGAAYPHVAGAPALALLVRGLLVAAVLVPPAVLMGASLPLACRQLVTDAASSSAVIARLYALNTAGAAVGCAVAGFVLVRVVGVDASLIAAGVASAAIGAVLLRLPLPAPGTAVAPAPALPARRTAPVTAMFFAIGAIALASEVAWARYLAVAVGNGPIATTLALLVTLVGIAVGTLLAARLGAARPARALGVTQLANGFAILAAAHVPAAWLATAGAPDRGATLAPLLVLLPSAICSGAALPLAARAVAGDPARAGASLGRLLAVNTAGSIAGSLVAGFWLLPVVGLRPALLALSALAVALGAGAWLASAGARAVVRFAPLVAAPALWAAIVVASPTRLPDDVLARDGELVDVVEGWSSNLAVVRRPDGLTLEIDRMWQGSERPPVAQSVAAHLPMLLHPHPERVLVVGLGTGQTARRFLLYPITRLDVVELERGLPALVAVHFESRWLADPRVHLVIDDARAVLAHGDARYDVISIEAGQTFRPGVAPLYTAEFYDAARARLAPDGVFVQFVSLPFVDRDAFATLVATFAGAFPHGELWYNRAELLLVGAVAAPPVLRADRLAVLAADPAIHRDLSAAYWGGPAEYLTRPEVLAAGFLAGPSLAAIAGDAPAYHDDRPWLEYETAPSDASEVAPIADELRAHLDPIRDIAPGLDAAGLARAEIVRAHDLGDLAGGRWLARAAGAERDGDAGGAIDALQRALAANPDDLGANLDAARLLAQRERTSELLPYLERAAALAPDRGDIADLLGVALARAGRVAEGARRFRDALLADPSAEPALRHLLLAVRVLREQGAAVEMPPDADDAARYRQLLAAGPQAAARYTAVAAALADAGAPELAAPFRDRAAALALGTAELTRRLAERDGAN